MGKMVTLTIDDRSVTVPEGMIVVDAAKKVDIDIPVFCYHPKLSSVGMCRMCLVEIGRPVIDRATGEAILNDEGEPQIRFGPKLETACTTPAAEGMVVVTNSKKVEDARREVLEFLLTSHPLDCPICDKGGECPLQNLTMGYGPGQSRFIFDEKMKLAKHYPLGELIVLDQERCIQCGRCIRFQEEIVDDPVIAFSQRGRALQIVTDSDPGFDSIFSGNTTDICPVGALTTADFRFGARPWELKPAASICNHCPVGCNITYNVRREVKSGGKWIIKRVMPRQNESVNEIWMCDKGRLVYHYTESKERLTQPYIRKNGKLEPAEWDEALDLAAKRIKEAGSDLVGVAGGRLSNEDLFNLHKLIDAQQGRSILYSHMAGGDWVSKVGVAPGTNFSTMGPETAILVVASDLHEEAPIWWARIKQASERGAKLIVVNPRPTRLDDFADHIVRYHYGQEAAEVSALLPGGKGYLAEFNEEVASVFAEASNGVVLYGSEGIGLAHSETLAQACAELLIKTGHYGKPNNGLIAVWPNGNTQGAWEMGFTPAIDQADLISNAKAVYIAGADPARDDPNLEKSLENAGFVVVQELFMTETAQLADVVLPVNAYTEREGTYTSGERRVQRFYPAISALVNVRPDFQVIAQVASRVGVELEGSAASLVFLQIARDIPEFSGLTYQKLAEVEEQWPIIGRSDLYYGGTSYDNHQGMGVQLVPTASDDISESLPELDLPDAIKVTGGALLVVPVTKLYDRGNLMEHTALLDKRKAKAVLYMHPDLAENHGLSDGDDVHLEFNEDTHFAVEISLDEDIPTGAALLPRSVGLPIEEPKVIKLRKPVLND